MRRLWLIALVLIGTLILAACGGAPAAESPTAAPEATPRPTSTPRPKPTEEPAEEPTEEPTEEPAEEPTEEPVEEPTAESGEQVTQPIDMTNLQTYSYKTGIFSIDVPESWSSDDQSSATEVLVRFSDEKNNGVVLVDLFEMAEEQSEEQLTKILNDYLDQTYTKQPEFSRDDPATQSDGSVLVVWGYDVEVTGGKTTRLLGNSFIEQRGNLISVLTLALPSEQFDALTEPINDVLNSYKIDTSVSVSGEADPASETSSGTLKPVEIGELETYTYDTGLFSIDVPTSWTIKDNSKAGEAIVLWTDPTENGLIVVDLFESQEEKSSEQLIELLRDFLKNSFESEADFTMDEPKEQSDGSQLIVWSYTANASGDVKAKLLGNSFIEQRDNKISILTTVVPEDQFDTLKPETNTIINSYSIDPSAGLPN
jgi:hypothetical protein